MSMNDMNSAGAVFTRVEGDMIVVHHYKIVMEEVEVMEAMVLKEESTKAMNLEEEDLMVGQENAMNTSHVNMPIRSAFLKRLWKEIKVKMIPVTVAVNFCPECFTVHDVLSLIKFVLGSRSRSQTVLGRKNATIKMIIV